MAPGGFIYLELMIASAIFATFVVFTGDLWSTMARQIQFLSDRYSVNQEARTARALLINDLALDKYDGLDLDDNSFTLYMSSSKDTEYVRYSYDKENGDRLTRSESTYILGASIITFEFPAAKYVTGATALYDDASCYLDLSYSFQKGRSGLTLNVQGNKAYQRGH